MLSFLLFVLLLTIGYLCGSICSAIIVCRLFSLPDPCIAGSKNPGATNVLRIAGKKYAAMVLIADMLKGLLPVLLAKLLGANTFTLAFTCLAAVIGHMYPVFFGFKGGKGVATALGALLGLHFIMGVIVIALWLLVANFSRYSSLASLVSMLLAPILSIVSFGNLDAFPAIAFITMLIFYKHRLNITRLVDGEEPKLSFSHHQLSDVADELLRPDLPTEVTSEPISPPLSDVTFLHETTVTEPLPSIDAPLPETVNVEKKTKPKRAPARKKTEPTAKPPKPAKK